MVHGYDYPVPDGRGFLGGWGRLPGPWLEPGFRRKGYSDMNERKQICVELIDRFNAMLAGLAGKPPFAHVKFLDLRKTLSTGRRLQDLVGQRAAPDAEGLRGGHEEICRHPLKVFIG